MLEMLKLLHWSLDPVVSIKKNVVPGRESVVMISLTSQQRTLQRRKEIDNVYSDHTMVLVA